MMMMMIKTTMMISVLVLQSSRHNDCNSYPSILTNTDSALSGYQSSN